MRFNKASLLLGSGLLMLLAAPAAAQSLPQAVALVLSDSPAVLAAKANREALVQEQREAFSGFFPEVSASVTAGRIYGDNATSRGLSVTRGAGYSGLGEGSVSVRQTIFDGFETLNRHDAALARTTAARFSIADVRETLALRTASTYMDIVRGRETLARIAAYNAKVADYLKRIETLVKQGAADESMAVQARDIKAQLENTLTAVQGQLEMSEAAYAELVGAPPEAGMTRPEGLVKLLPQSVDQTVQESLDGHPALRAAVLNEEASAHEIEIEKAGLFPDVGGELSYLKRDQRDLIGGESVDARAVVRMNWSFQTGGAQLARMEKAAHRATETQARRQEAMRQIERQSRSAWSDYETARRQLEILANRRQINRDLFKTQNTQFEGARITLLQLMQTDNALFNADLQYLNGEYRYLAAQYALAAAMGRLQATLINGVTPAAGQQEPPEAPAPTAAPVTPVTHE